MWLRRKLFGRGRVLIILNSRSSSNEDYDYEEVDEHTRFCATKIVETENTN